MQSYTNTVSGRRCSSEEDHEEDAKRKLKDMGMYEQGLSVTEMMNILRAVDQSKTDTGGMSRENLIMQIESPDSSEAHQDKSASKQSKHQNRDSASPDLPSNRCSNKNKDRKNSDEETVTAESTRARSTPESVNDNYVLSPSTTRVASTSHVIPIPSDNHQNITALKPMQKKSTPSIYTLRTPKWMIDPWNCQKDDDPPLKTRRMGNKAKPIRIREVNGILQIPADIQDFIKHHLQTVSRNHFINNRDKYEEEFQWGTPIKVEILNGNLEETPWREQLQTPSTSRVDDHETGVALRAVQQEERKKQSDDEDNDDEDDGDFESSRKRAKPMKPCQERGPPMKKTRGGKVIQSRSEGQGAQRDDDKNSDLALSSNETQSRKRPIKQRESTPEIVKKRDLSSEYGFETRERQNLALSDYLPNSRSERSESPELIEISQQLYPHRILSSYPSSSGLTSRGGGRKPSDAPKALKNRLGLVSERTEGNRKRKDQGLTEEEVQRAMDDVMTDDEEEPIYVPPKTTTKRSETALAILRNAREREEDEERKKRDAGQRKRMQEDSEKQLRVQQKIKEERANQRAKEALERHQLQRENKYKSSMRPKYSGKRTELDGDQAGNSSIVFEWDANDPATATTDDDLQMFEEKVIIPLGRVQCPICCKFFLESEIVDHAGDCADFPMEEDSDNQEDEDIEEVVERTSSPSILNCEICGRYSSRNGHLLEEHTNRCIAERNRASGSGSQVISTSTSPPRTFRPISALDNSEINYDHLRRNEAKSSPRGGNNRKRKR